MANELSRPELRAGSTALLIVDVQRALFSATPPPWDASGVIQRINVCAAAARKAGACVMVVQHDGDEEEDLVPFSSGWLPHPALQTADSDYSFRKTTCDAFYQTPLEQELRRRGIESLVLAGYATEFCIEATLRSGVSKNFRVVVLEDGHTTNDSPVLKAEAIIRHHNHTWPQCAAPNPVRVLLSAAVTFR